MTQRQWLWFGTGLFVLGLLKLVATGWYWMHRPVEQGAATVVCASDSSWCTLPGGTRLRFLQPPTAGRAFSIELQGASDVPPEAEFTMPNMDMGFNRYRFVRSTGGWTARVTLPACVSGQRDWEMRLTLSRLRYRIPFRAGRD